MLESERKEYLSIINWIKNDLIDVNDAIEYLKKDFENPNTVDWILCKDMLPNYTLEEDGRVKQYLITDINENMAIGYYSHITSSWYGMCLPYDDEDKKQLPSNIGEIVAWMPLPKFNLTEIGEYYDN